jgi:hypothetical protein
MRARRPASGRHAARATLLLAGIAPATAPGATCAVVHEIEAEGDFTDTLLGIVAIDDGWGIILFSVLLSIAESIPPTAALWACSGPRARSYSAHWHSAPCSQHRWST